MKAKAGAKRNGRKCLLGIGCWMIACLLLVLAWQSISTEKYALYNENLTRYRQEMQDCEALMDGPYAENYAYLASEWGKLVEDAEQYLTAHRVGAGSLGAVAALCVGMGGFWLVKGLKKEEAAEIGDSVSSAPSDDSAKRDGQG